MKLFREDCLHTCTWVEYQTSWAYDHIEHSIDTIVEFVACSFMGKISIETGTVQSWLWLLCMKKKLHLEAIKNGVKRNSLKIYTLIISFHWWPSIFIHFEVNKFYIFSVQRFSLWLNLGLWVWSIINALFIFHPHQLNAFENVIKLSEWHCIAFCVTLWLYSFESGCKNEANQQDK